MIAVKLSGIKFKLMKKVKCAMEKFPNEKTKNFSEKNEFLGSEHDSDCRSNACFDSKEGNAFSFESKMMRSLIIYKLVLI